MDTTPDSFDEEFDALFRTFVRGNGFNRPGIDEDYELRYRNMDRHVPEFCIHGFTRFRCAECNLNGFIKRTW